MTVHHRWWAKRICKHIILKVSNEAEVHSKLYKCKRWSILENNYRLTAVNYFCKTLHLRSFTGFWIRLWEEEDWYMKRLKNQPSIHWQWIWFKVFRNWPSKICGLEPLKIWSDMVWSRPYQFKFFKRCLPQILLGPFLNILTHFLELW